MVLVQLLLPEKLSRLRPRKPFAQVAMPKAAMHENNDVPFWKANIDHNARYPLVKREAKSSLMK
ncbi:MAG: hypothetical protein RID42_00815 [Alphaproteobacteria bacterium]